ncbi:hypothetical protein B4098_0214 [Heyndrickxia coagulans]|uniref:Uncharacterized protein n=1 Tax=Heyndrickxia coagulans TaxID=1398 RepID=A0A150K7A5_HEYCO|nr:hypothetical protein B4098_0214 [Heyndrickxia coagulans]
MTNFANGVEKARSDTGTPANTVHPRLFSRLLPQSLRGPSVPKTCLARNREHAYPRPEQKMTNFAQCGKNKIPVIE